MNTFYRRTSRKASDSEQTINAQKLHRPINIIINVNINVNHLSVNLFSLGLEPV